MLSDEHYEGKKILRDFDIMIPTLLSCRRQAETQEIKDPNVSGDWWSTDGVLNPKSTSGSNSHMSML